MGGLKFCIIFPKYYSCPKGELRDLKTTAMMMAMAKFKNKIRPLFSKTPKRLRAHDL